MRQSISLAICALAALTTAHAGDNPLDARFTLDGGWFFLSTDTRVRVNGEVTQIEGSDIDFEEAFGVEDVDRFRLDGMWRINAKHAIHALYFENNRSGSRTIDRTINFGDRTFPVSTTVSAKSSFTVAELYYDYTFVRRPNWEFAGGGGLHMLDLGLSLAGTVTGGGGSQSALVEESASTGAPLPVLGARGLWRISEKFYASVQAQYFYISANEYQGTLTDLKAQIVWQVMPHLGFGAGYDDFRFHFKIDGARNFDGRLNIGYGGAMVFAQATF